MARGERLGSQGFYACGETRPFVYPAFAVGFVNPTGSMETLAYLGGRFSHELECATQHPIGFLVREQPERGR